MKNYDHKLKLLSLINEKILNRSTEERYRLMHAVPSKSKKRWIPTVALSVAAVLLLSVVTVLLIPLLTKQIPVYTGMTVSSATENDVLDSGAGECRPVNVSYRFEASELPSVFKDPTKPGGEGEHTKEHENQKDPFGEIQASEDMYVARSGEKIRITIHFDNPEQYEILSFTINGIKYGSHMFLEGSDMEDLTVEYTVPEDAEGVLECTIDAIKYIDGTKIKDVKIGGDQTVRIQIFSVSALTFDLNGGSVREELPAFYYKDFETELPIPQREGYLFGGWLYEGQEAPVYAIPIGTKGALTVTAVWQTPSTLLTYLCSTMGGTVKKEFYEEQRFVEATQDYRAHIGVDIAVPLHAPVCAAASGVIDSMGVDENGTVVVEIKLSNNDAFLRYENFDSLQPGIEVGTFVNAGDVIGYAGGSSANPVCIAEPHLHVGIRIGAGPCVGWLDPQS